MTIDDSTTNAREKCPPLILRGAKLRSRAEPSLDDDQSTTEDLIPRALAINDGGYFLTRDTRLTKVALEPCRAKIYNECSLFRNELFSRVSWTWEADRPCAFCV